MKKWLALLLALALAGFAGAQLQVLPPMEEKAESGEKETAATALRAAGRALKKLNNGFPAMGNGDEQGYVQVCWPFGEKEDDGSGSYRMDEVLFYIDYASAVQRVLCGVPACGHDTKQCPAFLGDFEGVVWPQDGFVYRASEDGLWRMPLEDAREWQQLSALEGYQDGPGINYTDGEYYYYTSGVQRGTDGWNHYSLSRVPLAGGDTEPVELGENVDIRGCWEDKLVCLRTTGPSGTFEVDSPQARNARRQNSLYEIVTLRPGQAPETLCAVKPFLRDDSAMNFRFHVVAGAVYYQKEAQPGGSAGAGVYRVDLATGAERLFLPPDTPYHDLPTLGRGAYESAEGLLMAQREGGSGVLEAVVVDAVTGEEKALWPNAESGAPLEIVAVYPEGYLVYPSPQAVGYAPFALAPKDSFFTGLAGTRTVDHTALRELTARKG